MSKSDVASEVLAYCTSCKLNLNHVIVAFKKDKIAKVQCLTCKKEHTYKAPKGTSQETKKKKTKDSPTSEAHIESDWHKLMLSHKDSQLKPYSPKETFILGDKIKHHVFGEGIVERLIFPNKIEVLFKKDAKILIHQGVKN